METSQGSVIEVALRADIPRSDMRVGHVWFLNYAAIDPTAVKARDLDLHNAAMLPEDVTKFAHRWLAYSRAVDIQHNGKGVPVRVLESFMNSPTIASPAWPLNSHAVLFDVSKSKEAMQGLKTGKLNSVSLDALTFNRTRRLPVAQTERSMTDSAWQPPEDVSGWARDIAAMGYEGVNGVSQVADGLYVCSRSHGGPIAVHVTEESIEVNAGGGAWAHLQAALFADGKLVSTAIKGGENLGSVIQHGDMSFNFSYAPWDEAAVDTIIRQYFDTDPDTSPYTYVSEGDSHGILPHHTITGGQAMVSVEAVKSALGKLDLVPAQHRESARRHLLGHLSEAQQ